MSTITEEHSRLCDEAQALFDGLKRTADGYTLPPKTANRARCAQSSKSAGWGWTHYFLLADGRVMGRKLPDNMTFINRWAQEQYGWESDDGPRCSVFHLGRAVPRADTGEFVFEEWAFPVT